MTAPERLRIQDAAIILLRITLGVVFVYASIGKIDNPNAFAASVNGYRIVTGDGALLIATVLPCVELLSGLGLLLGLFWRGSALLVLLMLVLFTVAVISARGRGLDISCGCFTQDPAADPLGWGKVGENTVLGVIAFVVLCQPQSRFTLQHRLVHISGAVRSEE